MAIRAQLAGETPVTFQVESLSTVRKRVQEQGWHAFPHLLIRLTEDDARLPDAVEAALSTERAYAYRPWLAGRGAASAQVRPGAYMIEYFGDLTEVPRDGWIDLVVRSTQGPSYTLTVETPADIERSAAEDPGSHSHGFYYCPDLLIVREIETSLIESAIAALVDLGLHDYGILTGGARTAPEPCGGVRS